MQLRFISASILCFAATVPCIAQSSENKPARNQFGKINVAPLKDLVGKISEMCNSDGANPPTSSFSVVEAFEVNPDGSIPRSSMKVLKTSWSTEIDKTALQVLWVLGESHVLGVFTGLPSNTFEIKLSDSTLHLAIAIPAPTPEDASSTAEQVRFLLGVVKFAQKARNPLVSELLEHLAVKPKDKRITADLALPCGRVVEMLRTLNSR